MATTNPFLERSPLPYEAPPFDRIADEHYREALEAGMRREREEVEAIATQSDRPTFANTIEALERSGVLLRRVGNVFHEMGDSNSTPALRAIDTEFAPRLAAHHDEVHLDRRLFERVRTVYESRASARLDPESLRLLERTYREFVRAGAALSDTDQDRLRALNEEQARLTTEFRERLLAATDAGALVIEDAGDLDGLSESEIAAAAECAAERGLPGRFVLTLQNTTQQPLLTSLISRDLRRRLFDASVQRGHGGEHDTTALAARLAQLRAERARLGGFATFAAYELDDQVARTPERARRLMTDLVPAATARAEVEAAHLQALASAQGVTGSLGPHDWPYYAEAVRRAEYDVDVQEVRPYFEHDRVLEEGVFFSATEFFGITFRRRQDLPTYDPDVRVYEVFDHDGSPLALFYSDPFSRTGKSGGAWSHAFVEQSQLLGTSPVVVNVLNVTKPAPGDPVLLSFDEVETLFHEFGHALHAIFSKVKYPRLAGTNVPRDWVEFPSQIYEHCALDPAVFRRYARHHETGAPMPDALADRIRRLQVFNQGYRTTEYLAAALLDHAWHTLPAGTPLHDVAIFERAALERFGVGMPLVPPRYSTTYFLHIWGRGYAAAYYAYLWAEVADQDAWQWLQSQGGLTRENGQRLRDVILSTGDTEDADALFRRLCGRDPDIGPLLDARGLR